MIDALERQLAPLDKELRAYARRQPGCKALMAHYGIGPLYAVTILAELGDCPPVLLLPRRRPLLRPGHHRPPIRSAPRARPPLPPGTARVALGAVRGRPVPPGGQAHPTAPTTSRPRSGSVATAPACRSRASCSSAATTRCASSARRPCNPHDLRRCAPSPHSHRCAAAGSRQAPAATTGWTALKDRAAATLPPAGSIAVGTPVARRPPHRSQRARQRTGLLPRVLASKRTAGQG